MSGFSAGAVIGTLGGLIGLGGAEFRLPLLISVFRFAALEAVILNKAMTPWRGGISVAVSRGDGAILGDRGQLAYHRQPAVRKPAGAWLGASWAVKMKPELVYQIIAVLLVLIALVFAIWA